MRCKVMGIVNVTEDSFSDGGRWLAIDDALTHARRLIAQGADMIDVGGESTRPGAVRVPAEVERARVVPVIKALHEEGIYTSVDTMRASTAEAAAEAGVNMINDVSGGFADPDMYRVMADAGTQVCLMHWRLPEGRTYGEASGAAEHGNIVADVKELFDDAITAATNAGVSTSNIVLDPGLGFSKTASENWQLLQALDEFAAGQFPILVGASRKRFLAQIRKDRGLSVLPTDADGATAAVTAISAFKGAWAVRVHDVASSRDAVDVAQLWKAGTHG